jgi:hypothetical protein
MSDIPISVVSLRSGNPMWSREYYTPSDMYSHVLSLSEKPTWPTMYPIMHHVAYGPPMATPMHQPEPVLISTYPMYHYPHHQMPMHPFMNAGYKYIQDTTYPNLYRSIPLHDMPK